MSAIASGGSKTSSRSMKRKVSGLDADFQLSAEECPYMDTVNRQVLDFDFEKVCSVSLQKHNVYVCLVCGVYFQGRGMGTHAYFHSLDQDHHLFMNLKNGQVYCLPDGYMVRDKSLDDIRRALNPVFQGDTLASLDLVPRRYRTLDGSRNLQGVMGLNNLQATDYINVVLQAMMTVPPFRNFLLLHPDRRGAGPQPLTAAFSELTRKIWCETAFRNHLSPHQLVQQVVIQSRRKFEILKQGDPVEYLAWFLNTIDLELKGKDPKTKTIISELFRGQVDIKADRDIETVDENGLKLIAVETKNMTSQFLFLSVELPPKPLFKHSSEKHAIQQIPLQTLLQKFNGTSEHHVIKTNERRSYTLHTLPPYLILHIKRFTNNNFFKEKNTAVVLFPHSGLDMSDFLRGSDGSKHANATYSLTAAIVHDGSAEGGAYRVAVRHQASKLWFTMQDLVVKETLPQLVSLDEAHLLIYELDSS